MMIPVQSPHAGLPRRRIDLPRDFDHRKSNARGQLVDASPAWKCHWLLDLTVPVIIIPGLFPVLHVSNRPALAKLKTNIQKEFRMKKWSVS